MCVYFREHANTSPGLSWGGGRSEVKEEDWAKPGPGDISAVLRPSSDPPQKLGELVDCFAKLTVTQAII